MSAVDSLTVLTSLGRKLATKRISQVNGRFEIEPYARAAWFSVREQPVHDIASLGRSLSVLERDPYYFVIRGRPLPGSDRTRCRRLLYEQIEDGVEVAATFKTCARPWLAVDFDDLPAPVWDQEQLARLREAIERDRVANPQPAPLWRVGDLGELDPQSGDDLDPEPIDPARDWSLICHAAVATLPAEFYGISCWWQMTSSAGIKPGIRLRLWFWLDRPVSDTEAKRWLESCPVDRGLYNPIQAHYVAAPLFDPPDLDPVPQRSGFFWRCKNTVNVPELPEPAPQPEPKPCQSAMTGGRAARYAEACLRAVEDAQRGEQHITLRNVALRLFSLAAIGELEPARVRDDLLAIGRRRRWPERRVLDVIAWTTARAYADPQPPESWR
jgi:hypothetical protein